MSDTSHVVKSGINRWVMLLFSALLQLTVGVSYVWSVFQPVVMSTYGWDANTASMTYTVMFLTFVFGGMAGGQLQMRIDARKAILLGGILCFAGCAAATFTSASMPMMLYISYGGVVGFGLGILYNIAVALSQKWFPDRRGLASGVVIASLALSSIAFSPLFTWLLGSFGLVMGFWIAGGAMLAISVVCGFVLRFPPDGYMVSAAVGSASDEGQFKPGEIVKMPVFYAMCFAMTCAALSYILASPLLVSVGVTKGLDAGFLVIVLMVANAMNALSRLLMSALSDKLGRKPVLVIVFVINALGCAGLAALPGMGFAAAFCVLCFGYGGFFAIYPAVVSDMFGVKYAGANYGLVMLGLAVASILSMIVGSIISAYGMPIEYRFIFSAVFAVLGVVLVFFIKPAVKKA